MKKNKLNSLEFSVSELLSREQMKMIYAGDGGSGDTCKSGDCTLSIQGSDGNWITRSGKCAGTAVDADLPDFPHMECYCNVGLGSDIPVTSNGGTSRCYN